VATSSRCEATTARNCVHPQPSEAINLAGPQLGDENIPAAMRFCDVMEHHSNLGAWRCCCTYRAVLRHAGLTETGASTSKDFHAKTQQPEPLRERLFRSAKSPLGCLNPIEGDRQPPSTNPAPCCWWSLPKPAAAR